MAGLKQDIIWSPVHKDKFIIWGSNITLYEVAPVKDIDKKTNYVQISATSGATVVASQSASGVRSVDVSHISDQPDPLLALGHASGKVTLTSLKQTYDPLGLVGNEFVPQFPRLCNSVAWNPVESNLLASGMEKYRSEHCILVWDVHKGGTPTEETTEGTISGAKPIAEMGLTDTAHSVSWAKCSDRTLLASMNLKHIKIFDLRDWCNKGVSAATSRYCYGVCADPFNWWQVATRGDSALCVWDARRFTRPLLTLQQQRPVLKMQWCPTRRNLLLSLQRDSTTLRMHDLQQATLAADEAADAEAEEQSRGPSVLERDVSPTGHLVVGFCWHPTAEARLLALGTGDAVAEYGVCERAALSWGAGAGLAWAAGGEGGGTLRRMGDSFYAALQDISYTMRKRAQTEYGLAPDLWQVGELAADEALSGAWSFMALSRSLVEDGCIRNGPCRHPGVRSVLRAPGEGGYRSEAVPSLLPDLPSRRVTLWRSGERTRALQLCGWGWGWENAGLGVERAEAEGTPCRAAALAVFHLRLRAALDVLTRAASPQLRVAALALAGLSDERLWREALAAAAPAMPDAYLRALLHFLAASGAGGAGAGAGTVQPAAELDPVLEETEMRLEDRVAFACVYLSDAKLHDYVRRTTERLVERGDLSGLLLTGASGEGVALLQRWVERTGDVQSAALIAVRCFTPELLRDPRVVVWLDSYRQLLDSWKLWWARCALDTAAGGEAGARLVCAACSYCGKAVAAEGGPRRQPRLPPPAKAKAVAACPHCRKPLPRCGVCALHMGTGAAGAPFAAWFSWCVACRHGGHAAHLLHWFRDHAECPVASCTCRCSQLDPPDD